MNYFFVDLENVHILGLTGINNLGAEDAVYIFCGAYQLDNISVNFLSSIKCKVHWIRVKRVGDNYLDFQLAMYATKISVERNFNSEDSIFVISEDSDFLAVKDFFEDQGISLVLQERIDGIIVPRPNNGITLPHTNKVKDGTKAQVKSLLSGRYRDNLEHAKACQEIYEKIRSSQSISSFRKWVKQNFPYIEQGLIKAFYIERGQN